MRKSSKLVMAYQCDWCGDKTPNFIVNAEHKHFCFEAVYGQKPTKDCLNDYVQKKKKQKESLFSQKKKQFQEEEKVLTPKVTAIKKLEELKQFLSKKTNHPS